MKVAKPFSNKEDMVFFDYVNIDSLVQGVRIRDIDDATVDTLVESFKQFGVLNPVTVATVANSGKYKVIVGHHRYLAFKRLLATVPENDRSDFKLPATIMYINEGDDTEAMQIAENLHRNDYTLAERKEQAVRYGTLVNGQGSDSGQGSKNGQGSKTGPKQEWFRQWYEKCGLAQKTAQRMWEEFRAGTGLTVTPSKATKEQQQQFFQWHEEQMKKEKDDEAAKAKQSEDERNAKILAEATETYQRAKGIYQRACDVAHAAGVPDIQFIQ